MNWITNVNPNFFQGLEKSTNPEEVKMVGRVIWFTCEGENPADIENMGDITFYPYQGVADYFFPYKNQRGYLSPAVFVHVSNPKSKFAGKSWERCSFKSIYAQSLSNSFEGGT
jgi:hypothetical protein